MSDAAIPKHKLCEKFQGEMIVLWRMNPHREHRAIDYAHRDDYYMFLFLEQGYAKIAIDFEEYQTNQPAILFIHPEQVHLLMEQRDLQGWVLIVDKMLISTQHKQTFERASLKEGSHPTPQQTEELGSCLALLNERLLARTSGNHRAITHALLSACIGMVAEIYQTHAKPSSKRLVALTAQFRALLSTNYKTTKRPSQYAQALAISPIYLNEILKKTMGITATAAIHNEIIVQAKRLLFYTTLTVKEVAFELGYDDWAYFTRIFTQITATTPTQFRAKYLK